MECAVPRNRLTRQVFKVAMLSLAVLGGLVEWAALLRARASMQLMALRRA
jgi:hypothetical protein